MQKGSNATNKNLNLESVKAASKPIKQSATTGNVNTNLHSIKSDLASDQSQSRIPASAASQTYVKNVPFKSNQTRASGTLSGYVPLTTSTSYINPSDRTREDLTAEFKLLSKRRGSKNKIPPEVPKRQRLVATTPPISDLNETPVISLSPHNPEPQVSDKISDIPAVFEDLVETASNPPATETADMAQKAQTTIYTYLPDDDNNAETYRLKKISASNREPSKSPTPRLLRAQKEFSPTRVADRAEDSGPQLGAKTGIVPQEPTTTKESGDEKPDNMMDDDLKSNTVFVKAMEPAYYLQPPQKKLNLRKNINKNFEFNYKPAKQLQSYVHQFIEPQETRQKLDSLKNKYKKKKEMQKAAKTPNNGKRR